eukprot:gene12124-13376_t
MSSGEVCLTSKQKQVKAMEYSVKSTDTLASIALKFNTTRSELSRMNRLSSRVLYPGQTLFVPAKIDLLEKEAAKSMKQKNEIELVTRAPQSRAFPDRQMTLSPDLQMEELLKRDETGKDEVSEKYLSINGRYITDGQGVVPGVLLVTPQTVMFNPSVSDHLVIDRGREAYIVRTPIKAVKKASYYKDVAAMVLGDTSEEFIPTLVTNDGKDLSCSKCNSMDTSNYVSQDTIDMLSEANVTYRKYDSKDAIEKQQDNESRNLESSQDNMSQDDTFTSCACSAAMSVDDLSQDSRVEMSMNQDTFEEKHCENKTVEMADDALTSKDELTAENTRTNHDRKGRSAEIPRDGIDIMDTEYTSTPRKTNENTKAKSTAEKLLEDDSGFIYTKVESMDTVKKLTGNSVTLELYKNKGSEQLKDEQPLFDGHSKEANSFRADESSGFIDASRDSGISEGMSLQSNSSFQSSKSQSKNTLLRNSSLSSEAKMWLGKRGIRLNSQGDPEDVLDSAHTVTPRPAAPTADDLVYLCLKVSDGYWCKPPTRVTHIMGIPPNRDQMRKEHWFAVPKHRVNQLYTFLNTWCLKSGSQSLDDTGIRIIDDTFSQPTAEEIASNVILHEHFQPDAETYKQMLNLGQFSSLSRKSTQSSLNDDDVPELDDESNILSKTQLTTLSRELPSRTVGHRWNLVYSTAVHGISLKTLYRNTLHLDAPILLVVVDQEGRVFGAFISDPPKVSEGFYGTGESMLFTFEDDNRIKVYRWSGTNTFFVKGDSKCLAIGGGDGLFGLWLDEDLYHGRSHSCKTFDNETLSSKEDFICGGLEAWAFG